MPSEDSSPVGSSCIFVFTALERSDCVLMVEACAVLTNTLAQTSFLLPYGKYLLVAFLFCSFSQGKPKTFKSITVLYHKNVIITKIIEAWFANLHYFRFFTSEFHISFNEVCCLHMLSELW